MAARKLHTTERDLYYVKRGTRFNVYRTDGDVYVQTWTSLEAAVEHADRLDVKFCVGA